MFDIEMSKAIKITIPSKKPRNWAALSARLKKGGVHQSQCSRNAERQAWTQDWADDLVASPTTQSDTSE